MNTNPLHRYQKKPDLTEELYRRYAAQNSFRQKMCFVRKKYAWILITRSAWIIKRLFDIIVSAVTILLLAPLLLTIALCIKLTDGGPVFYFQIRVGQWGREFRFPKFRSMVADADKIKDKLREQNQHGSEGVTFKMKNDPRITWIGRIIRKLSLDEMPQLWCVLKGDMSLVGPRPPTVDEVAKYTLKDRRRLDAMPGLTCTWQVTGRSDIPFEQQVKLDVEYIESQNLWLDFIILMKTIPAVLFGRGAY